MCHCKYCATYTDVLGRSEEVLDARRGTDAFFISPHTLEIESGREHIACLRLTDKGALRFYASCCNTPLANTAPAKGLPILSVSPMIVPWRELGRERDELLGPIRARVNTDDQFAPDERRSQRARSIDLVTMLLRFAPKFALWWVRGAQRRSPFVNAEGGPLVEPQRVSRDTRLEPKGA